jgi:L-asparaginase
MTTEHKNYRIVNVTSARSKPPKARILVVYTGGTLGMEHDESGALVALNFNHILQKVPTLTSLDIDLTVISFPTPLDSSNVTISEWQDIGYIIYENHQQFDGFVVLHGTDTMSYTASALSFMLNGLNKPVIFTGAQLPISAIRSDARANFVTAIEIAAAKKRKGRPMVPEVGIYFDYQLFRANRTFKKRSNQFAAFGCENYPILAKAGVKIVYHEALIKPYEPNVTLDYKNSFDTHVFILKIFPSIQESFVRHVINMPGLKGLILETFGSGNAPTEAWFLDCLREAAGKGIILYNVSQLIGGMVMHGRYETSKYMEELGIVSGSDITREAALVKLMFLLGTETETDEIKRKLSTPLCGEMTV